MQHQPYLHLVPGSDTALLLIHGILGTPNHFANFLPLVDPHWSVYNLLLDGHGKGVREFSRTSMKKWRLQVQEAVALLAKDHQKILIAGHSLGCLLAIEQALACSKIAGLFLLAPPLRLRIRARLIATSTKVYLGRIRPDDPESLAAQRLCGVRQEWQFWRYLGWIPRFLELFDRIQITKSLVPKLHVPCHVVHSRRDEMVSSKGLSLFPPTAKIFFLASSTHFYYPPADEALLLQLFQEFCLQL